MAGRGPGGAGDHHPGGEGQDSTSSATSDLQPIAGRAGNATPRSLRARVSAEVLRVWESGRGAGYVDQDGLGERARSRRPHGLPASRSSPRSRSRFEEAGVLTTVFAWWVLRSAFAAAPLRRTTFAWLANRSSRSDWQA